MGAVDEDTGDIATAILWLLDIPDEASEPSAWIDLDAAVRRQRTINAINRLILRLSRVQPLIILFEDLQWIDAESEAVLEAIMRSLPTSRILLLITYRNEYEHGWGGRTFYSQVRLDPLSARTVEGFLSICWVLTSVWSRSN